MCFMDTCCELVEAVKSKRRDCKDCSLESLPSLFSYAVRMGQVYFLFQIKDLIFNVKFYLID